MSVSNDYGVPEVKSKVIGHETRTYEMENVTCEALPDFTLKAGNNGKYPDSSLLRLVINLCHCIIIAKTAALLQYTSH